MKIKSRWKWAAMDENGDWWMHCDRPRRNGKSWEVAGDGVVWWAKGFEMPEVSDWKDSLHQIVNGELIKHVVLKIDDRVMVRDKGGRWRKRYFSRVSVSGRILTFGSGATSWNKEQEDEDWDEWRLPTEDELE